MRALVRTVSCTSVACAALAWFATAEASAYERQWHLGGEVGYLLAGYDGGPYSGFGGGAHLAYGLNDFLNLRLHSDVSGYPLPDPLPSALLWNTGAGVEFSLDIVQWVPYIGGTVGFAYLNRKDAADAPLLSLEAPLGVLYYPSRDIGVGLEFRYRALLFTPDGGPVHNGAAFVRLEYVWGY